MQVAFYFAGEITQVLDAIPWVCCASDNVLLITGVSQTGGWGGPPLGNFSHKIPFFSPIASLIPVQNTVQNCNHFVCNASFSIAGNAVI